MPQRKNPPHLSEDHDILVQTVEILSQMRVQLQENHASLKGEMKDLRDSQSLQVAKVDARLATLETFNIRNNLEEKVKRWDTASKVVEDLSREDKVKRWDTSADFTEDLTQKDAEGRSRISRMEESSQWVIDFRKSWKLILAIITALSGMVAYLINNVGQFWRTH